MEDPSISAIRVFGLHDQFNVVMMLNRGLNVLYGKNGRGKTTLLHIIANILEMDFARFRFLQFKRIELETHSGAHLEIEKTRSSEAEIHLRLNGITVQLDATGTLATEDRQKIRASLGSRPIYLPAFRSILERVRSDSYYESQRNPDYERIRDTERALQREFEPQERRSLSPLGRYDPAALTARKTIQCREWFGQFVPVIRYPSIDDVTDRLATEQRDAQLETGMVERRMLSEMFVEVLKALLSDEDVPTENEVDTLLRRVRTALASEDDDDDEADFIPDDLGSRLTQVVGSVKTRGGAQGGSAERRVLRLYADMLERRNKERKSAFDRVRQFESAVNKFLDNKTLHVTDNRFRSSNSQRRGVYVESKSNRKYPLSSLSSGERQVLTMIFSATRMSVANGVFLVDEPELSLHVDWQRIILSELMTQAGGRQIIACTHSPEVGADHSDSVQFFDPEAYYPALPQQQDETTESLLDDAI